VRIVHIAPKISQLLHSIGIHRISHGLVMLSDAPLHVPEGLCLYLLFLELLELLLEIPNLVSQLSNLVRSTFADPVKLFLEILPLILF
jgi:hypothetical protein